MNLFRGIMLTAVVLSSPACADRAEVPSEPAHPKNVILVLIDTLRADHTAIHGYPRPTTPILEQLAEESVVFDRARSQAGCTFPSMNSLLTSRYPFDFYRREPGEMGIPVEYPSIAEVLKAHGYITVAVSASPIVRATPSEHNPSAGFGRGFDIFDEQCLWREAACVNHRALEIIENLQEPFFLYLHYMDPHDSYEPPKTYQRFAGPYEGFEFIAAGDPNPIGEMLYDDGPNVDIDDQDIKHLVDLYDDEILYVDTMLGEFLRSLRGTGALDDSIFILTSDHGEEFLEHGHVKHCRGVWDTLTRVPLLIRFPKDGVLNWSMHPYSWLTCCPQCWTPLTSLLVELKWRGSAYSGHSPVKRPTAISRFQTRCTIAQSMMVATTSSWTDFGGSTNSSTRHPILSNSTTWSQPTPAERWNSKPGSRNG